MPNLSVFTADKFNVVVGGKIGCYNKLNNCTIENSIINSSNISNCIINGGTEIEHAFMRGTIVGNNAKIGVFSRLRENSIIGNNVKIGNFVETKNATISTNSKIPHLSYVGDAKIGKNVNVGCGTVFCNYDGKIKQQTIVGDNVFVGSNSNLIAPVTIESNSFIAAGSTITNLVPANALAIARSRQINKLNYIK